MFILERRRRFSDLTATSALPFDEVGTPMIFFGKPLHFLRKLFVRLAVNSGPPSDDSSSGTPNVANSDLKHAISPLAPALELPLGVE